MTSPPQASDARITPKKRQSWKTDVVPPRFVQTAIRKGLRIADSINIEEANDKSWLRITFKKWPVVKP